MHVADLGHGAGYTFLSQLNCAYKLLLRFDEEAFTNYSDLQSRQFDLGKGQASGLQLRAPAVEQWRSSYRVLSS